MKKSLNLCFAKSSSFTLLFFPIFPKFFLLFHDMFTLLPLDRAQPVNISMNIFINNRHVALDNSEVTLYVDVYRKTVKRS